MIDTLICTMLIESMMLVAVADVLIDAASVLGGDATLRILYKKLVEVSIILFNSWSGILYPMEKLIYF